MSKELQNFNARVSAETLKKIQMESMFADVSQQDFAARVFEHFLALPKHKRREILKGAK